MKVKMLSAEVLISSDSPLPLAGKRYLSDFTTCTKYIIKIPRIRPADTDSLHIITSRKIAAGTSKCGGMACCAMIRISKNDQMTDLTRSNKFCQKTGIHC